MLALITLSGILIIFVICFIYLDLFIFDINKDLHKKNLKRKRKLNFVDKEEFEKAYRDNTNFVQANKNQGEDENFN